MSGSESELCISDLTDDYRDGTLVARLKDMELEQLRKMLLNYQWAFVEDYNRDELRDEIMRLYEHGTVGYADMGESELVQEILDLVKDEVEMEDENRIEETHEQLEREDES